jgi:uncharacterized protein YndB with AHSA1/START domain
MKITILTIPAAAFLICSFSGLKENTSLTNQNNTTMETKNFKTSFVVDQSAEKVFHAINDVRGWWSENIIGGTENLNDEFIYQYKDVHHCKIKLVESVPNKRVVWLVLENEFNFTKDKSEWKGDTIVFGITEKDGKTQLEFTHIGLVPAYECFNVCQDAWSSYIQGSLKSLITTGKGKPNTKENDLNGELVEKWGLPDTEKITKYQTAHTKQTHFSYSFKTPRPAKEVFDLLLDVKHWWSGLYEETIKGKSVKPGDEFTFRAGGGMHYTKQKLVELIPGKRIVWLVTESELSFLNHPAEWEGTKIRFDLSTEGKDTQVTFTHEGLVPQIECYDNCSNAWTGYLNNLKKALGSSEAN